MSRCGALIFYNFVISTRLLIGIFTIRYYKDNGRIIYLVLSIAAVTHLDGPSVLGENARRGKL